MHFNFVRHQEQLSPRHQVLSFCRKSQFNCNHDFQKTLQPYWQPHNRAVARRIQNMGWRADGGLWLLVRGGGLYLSKGTGVCTSEMNKGSVHI